LNTFPLHFKYISWYVCLSIFFASRYLRRGSKAIQINKSRS
jgi:hypothetical protein